MPNMKLYDSIDFWNGEDMIEMRKTLLKGEIPDSCKDCIKVGSHSPCGHGRVLKEVVPLNFNMLSLARDNKCNLACEMCESGLSTTFDKLHNDGKTGYIENNYDLTDHVPDMERVFVSGGNPVMDDKVYDLLVSLDPNITKFVMFTSNGSHFPDKFLEVLKKFDNVLITVSIDADKELNEIVRFFGKNDKIYQTINRLVDGTRNCPNVTVSMLLTLTNKTILRIRELYEEAKNFVDMDEVRVIFNNCHYPERLSLLNLQEGTLDKIKSDALFFKQEESIMSNHFLVQISKTYGIAKKYDPSQTKET